MRFCLIRLAGQYLLSSPPAEPSVYDPQAAARDAGWPEEVYRTLQPTHLQLGAMLAWQEAVGIRDAYADVASCFTHGLSLGYEGPRTTILARTVPTGKEQLDVLRRYVDKEVQEEGHIAHLCTFPSRPGLLPAWLPYLRASPISAIPKRANGVVLADEWRVIHNLSHNKLFGNSVNDHIDPQRYEFEFVKFDAICEQVRNHGVGAVGWKDDMPQAFKVLPVCLEDALLLGFEFRGELFVDTRAPMGAVSIPFTYSRFADGLRVINQLTMAHPSTPIREQPQLQNYLDDFWKWNRISTVKDDPTLLGRLSHAAFRHQLATMKLFPKPKKTVESCQELPILGLMFNSLTQKITVPPARVAALRTVLPDWIQRTHATKRELQSLIGVLSFCCRGVRFGRAFLRRLIDLTTTLPYQESVAELTPDMQADVAWWQKFAFTEWQGVSYLMDPTPIELARMAAFSYADSCGEECAAGVGDDWFSYAFTPEQRGWHIGIKELFTCIALCKTFGGRLRGRVLVIPCDNESAVAAIQATRAKDPLMNSLVRELFFITSLYSIQVIARHVSGRLNVLADYLSRPRLRHLAWQVRPSLSRVPVQPCLPTMDW
jgi:hypothetical protein